MRATMSTLASTEMQAYYAARAPIYDAVYAKPERASDIAFLRDYLPRSLTGRDVLELACGTGYWTQHIAPAARRLLASDGTAEPLALARLRPNCEAVDFHQVDAYALPDDLGSFDGAFAGLWFSHVLIEDRERFLDGLHRHLRAGARVVFIDNNRAQCRELPIVEIDAQGNTWQRRTLPDGSQHRVLKNFPDEPELRELLEERARSIEFKMLENFWLLSYELA
jgi:SAM-dependent methyltransferase